MVLLDKLWDDVVAGPSPDHGLDKLRRLNPLNTLNLSNQEMGESSGKCQRSTSMPVTPKTPVTPTTPGTPGSAKRENVWRSVFNPGSNLNTKNVGAHYFDKPSHPTSPTVYDWLYSGETRSKHH